MAKAPDTTGEAARLVQQCRTVLQEALFSRLPANDRLIDAIHLLSQYLRPSALTDEQTALLTSLEDCAEWDLQGSTSELLAEQVSGKLLRLYDQVLLATVRPPERSIVTQAGYSASLNVYSSLFVEAIQQRRKVTFLYQDSPRVGAPYILGTSRREREAVLLYQTGGWSSSGTLRMFKYFLLEKMSELTLLDEKFRIKSQDYNPNDSFFIDIFASVDD